MGASVLNWSALGIEVSCKENEERAPSLHIFTFMHASSTCYLSEYLVYRLLCYGREKYFSLPDLYINYVDFVLHFPYCWFKIESSFTTVKVIFKIIPVVFIDR